MAAEPEQTALSEHTERQLRAWLKRGGYPDDEANMRAMRDMIDEAGLREAGEQAQLGYIDATVDTGRLSRIPTPDPITRGTSHRLDAWNQWWDRHGYEPWALERDQASPRAQALMDEADRLLEHYRLDPDHNGTGAEMRHFGEEVLIPMTAPHGAQIHTWVPVDAYEPTDLAGLIADELSQYMPVDDDPDEQHDAEYFHDTALHISGETNTGTGTVTEMALDPADPLAMSALGETGTNMNTR